MAKEKKLKEEKFKVNIGLAGNKPKKFGFNADVAKKRKESKKKPIDKSNKSHTKKVDSLGRDISLVAERIAKNKQRILEELKKTFGIVTSAIAKVKIENSTFYKWYKEDDEFAKAVDEIQNGFDVIVEDKLKQKIIQNDGHSIRFYLSHRVKKYRPNLGIGQAEDLEPIEVTIREYKPGDEIDND